MSVEEDSGAGTPTPHQSCDTADLPAGKMASLHDLTPVASASHQQQREREGRKKGPTKKWSSTLGCYVVVSDEESNVSNHHVTSLTLAIPGSRPRRQVIKRKRLIEDDKFHNNCVKRNLLTNTVNCLTDVADAVALDMGHILQNWVGTRSTFFIGDHVMARYSDGQWFGAVVEEREEGGRRERFRLRWNDGDTEDRVKPAAEMMLIQDFNERAEKLFRRQKSNVKVDLEKIDGGEKGAVPEKVGRREKNSCTNAVYTFVGAESEHSALHRRNWGLKMMDAVGRCRPPFARTLLFHGTLPFPLPADLHSGEGHGRHWVVKRWPNNSSAARRKIDKQVHECIQKHPHPSLVRILDVSPTEGVLMDYYQDGDLQRHMTKARRKHMPLRDVVGYLLHLLRAVAHLHALNIVHCDVTPANVLLRRHHEREERDERERQEREEALRTPAQAQDDTPARQDGFACALGDFGHSYILNQHEESRSSVAGEGLGSVFIAPEVKEGGVSTKESDVYSAGRILEELLNLSSALSDEDMSEDEGGISSACSRRSRKSRAHTQKRARSDDTSEESEIKSLIRELHTLAADMCSCVASNRPTAAAACQRLDSLVSQFDSYQMSLGALRQSTCSPEAAPQTTRSSETAPQATCSPEAPPSSSSLQAPPSIELIAA